MPHFTPQAKSPKPESLLYITAFARLYSPAPDNEQTARTMRQYAADKQSVNKPVDGFGVKGLTS